VLCSEHPSAYPMPSLQRALVYVRLLFQRVHSLVHALVTKETLLRTSRDVYSTLETQKEMEHTVCKDEIALLCGK
jgi:hypothetical protein